jgi:hypothetical protein
MELFIITLLTASLVMLIIYSVTWMPTHPSKWDNAIGFVLVLAFVSAFIHILLKVAGAY